MSELPSRRSALVSVLEAGDFGALLPSGPGVLLAEQRGRAIVQLAADPADWDAIAGRVEDALELRLPCTPNRAIISGELAALGTGPGRALVVGPDHRDLEVELAAALNGEAVALVGLGHSRTVLRLTGRHARDLLAKGCGLDFHPRSFGAGSCLQSIYNHVGVLIHALDDTPTVELYVYRSLAVSLWNHLLEGSLEFGCRVVATHFWAASRS